MVLLQVLQNYIWLTWRNDFPNRQHVLLKFISTELWCILDNKLIYLIIKRNYVKFSKLLYDLSRL